MAFFVYRDLVILQMDVISPELLASLAPTTQLQQPQVVPISGSVGVGELYERFVRKRALVKYQSQSELIEVLLYYLLGG